MNIQKPFGAFEDMGHLNYHMDRRMDIVLKRAWDASMANLKPALATTWPVQELQSYRNFIPKRKPQKQEMTLGPRSTGRGIGEKAGKVSFLTVKTPVTPGLRWEDD